MVQVLSFPRDDFLSRRWRYRAGEHVTILGPTGSGKTYLGYQLLEKVATPKLPGIVLVMKPRDATVRFNRGITLLQVTHFSVNRIVACF